ncbi:membrane protein YczE [Sinomonas atrocyanea]
MNAFLDSPHLAVRLVRLYVGLAAYGLAIALLLRSGLGSSPWDVLSQGVARTAGLSFGATTVAVSVLVLAAWIPLRQRPGWGTLSNTLLIGVFADLGLAWIPAPPEGALHLLWQCSVLAGGLVLLALASALYIGARLGPGPRDGLMTGLVARTGRPVWMVRCAIELTVVLAGWLLGGTVGIGTAVFAFGIGPLIQAAMRLMRVDLGPRADRSPGNARASEEPGVSGAAAR